MAQKLPYQHNTTPTLTRRELLERCGMGFGLIGLAGVMADNGLTGRAGRASADVQPPRSLGPMAPKSPHFAPKAKQVVHLFMNGGPSHVDTFDPKPVLTKYHGKTLPTPNLRTERKTGAALRSPFTFRKYGESGIEVSELFARTAASMIDEIVRHPLDVCRRAQSRAVAHVDELRRRPVASAQHGRPGSLTAWAPRTRTCPASSPCVRAAIRSWQPQNWRSAFLPGAYQGTYIDTQHTAIDKLIENIRNAAYRRRRSSAGSSTWCGSSTSGMPWRAGTIRSSRRASSRSSWPIRMQSGGRGSLRHQPGAALSSATSMARALRPGSF